MKKQTYIALFCISLSISIFALTSLKNTAIQTPGGYSLDRSGLIDTATIDQTQSTGGTSKTKPASNDNSNEQAPSEPFSTETSIAHSEPEQRLADNSPKQTAIKQSVSRELPYRALLLPNDPYAQDVWQLNALNAPTAWQQSTGGNVVVAVIDSGFALAHQDLASIWKTNDGEQGMTNSGDRCWDGTPRDKQSNGCDDDANGYVDDWRGWNFVAIDNNPQAGRDNPTGDAVSHGTQVAGLAGAATNNGIGMASLNWDTRLMPLQALSDNGAGYTSDVAAAIYYAVDNGADVINLSLGGMRYDPYVRAATDYAYANDVVVVAAAGNCGSGAEYGCDPQQSGQMSYPALNPHVISVGAANSSGQRASFSSYGPGLDLIAPGSGQIISTMWTPSNPTSAYAGTLYGTSFAAPITSSLVSLLRSERPGSSVDDIISLVDGTASKTTTMSGAYYTSEYGHGLADAEYAMRVAESLNSATGTPTLAQTGSEISEHSFRASSTLSSGCSVSVGTYCTVWARDSSGHDRYLPYLSTENDAAGWQWPAASLGSGEWRLRARSGDLVSTTSYYLFAK